ncbi:putative RNA recognition motif domain, nucleotide-binding alpha-beta plait domain superfamily [Helianthus debilis subsp. tardiflorus]
MGGNRFKENTWYDVPAKKGRGNISHQRPNTQATEVKFFVSNLPERCSSSDLLQVLKGFGDIQGTYIARKYDRLGKKFGFVTFRNVRNPLEMEKSLKDRVQRKEDKEWQPVKDHEIRSNDLKEVKEKETVVEKSTVNVSRTRSFRDMLINKDEGICSPEIVLNPNVRAFSEWYDYGLIAKNSDEKDVFLLDKGAWLSCFDRLETWKGDVLEFERVAWVKMHGVPLTLSCSHVFDEIASRFATVIQSAQFSEEEGDLSHACVGILVKMVDRIYQKCKLNWRNHCFEMLIEEEAGEWIPDCLVDLEEIADGQPEVDSVMADTAAGERSNDREEEKF